tara:strand:- start:1981 stop:3057 length:1077 start_codon:yes stop_codon:yes gene_type:complete
MARVVVADSLYLVENPSYVQVYDNETLEYLTIVELVDTPFSILSADNLGFTVTPVDQVGSYKYIIRLSDGSLFEVPMFFASQYYKQESYVDDYLTLFPQNFLRFYEEDPDTAIFNALSVILNSTLPPTEYIPFLKELHPTFPQYCSNQLVGINICLLYGNYLVNTTQQWVEISSKESKRPLTDTALLIDTASNLSSIDELGYYHKFTFGGEGFSARYGANSLGQFTLFQRALNLKSVSFDVPATRLSGWEESSGISLVSEVLYSDEPLDITLSEYTVKVIPTIERYQGSDYDPEGWVAQGVYTKGDESDAAVYNLNRVPDDQYNGGAYGSSRYTKRSYIMSYDGKDFLVLSSDQPPII